MLLLDQQFQCPIKLWFGLDGEGYLFLEFTRSNIRKDDVLLHVESRKTAELIDKKKLARTDNQHVFIFPQTNVFVVFDRVKLLTVLSLECLPCPATPKPSPSYRGHNFGQTT